MKIKVTDYAAVEAALAKVNGKASAFTATAGDVQREAERAEKTLEARGVTKANRSGCALLYRPGGPSANRYEYAAISTHVRLERGSKDWFLTVVVRDTVYPKTPEKRELLITLAAQEDVIRHAMRGMRLREGQLVQSAA
jgi:hypothetical protein